MSELEALNQSFAANLGSTINLRQYARAAPRATSERNFRGELIVAGRDAPGVHEAPESILDRLPALVAFAVGMGLSLAVRSSEDDGTAPTWRNDAERIGVIAPVGEQIASPVDVREQVRRGLTSATLPGLSISAYRRSMSQRQSIIIRDYRAGDAQAMAEIYHAAVRHLGPRRYSPEQVAAWSPSAPDPARFASRAGDGRFTLLADHRSAGVVAFGDLEPNGHIDLLYCRPEFAGTGMAARILDALLERAVAARIDRLFVEASELARGLFERRGFALVKRRDFALGTVSMHNYLLERNGT